MKKKLLSVVIAFFNEESNLEKLHKELLAVLSKLKIDSEIIYVNDGSVDRSEDVLKRVIDENSSDKVEIKYISLKKNFGQTAAVSAGIDNSRGDYISFLDADLQNDPADIPRFLEKLNKGYDAVFGWRKQRKDATFRSFLSILANGVIRKFFAFPFHDVGCSARIVKREYINDIKLYGELHRLMPVLIYLKGAKIAEIVVSHRERYKGKSKYGYKRIIKVIIDMITVRFLHSYGTKPAYVFGSVGLSSIGLGIVSLLAVAYRKLFLGVYVHRDPIFLIAIFFLFVGVQFVLMGLLAELMVRTYFESQDKHIYDIRDINNF